VTSPARAALPIAAIVVFAVTTIAIVATAGSTLGYDFEAYRGAADRLLLGQPLYDPSVDVAGGFAVFLYPPPFAIALLPFAVVPHDLGLVGWEILTIAVFLIGVAILPVRPAVRWAILLLGGLDWPLLFAFKLGQVGPLLFLLFAIGWRWRDRPWALGLSIAAGAIVKVQPLLLVIWAALTGRWRAAAIAVGALLITAIISLIVVGPGAWADYVALLRRVSSPITTPHNFTLGAIAFQGGMDEATAGWLQLGWTVAVVATCLYATLRAPDDVSYLAVVVATQVLAPLVWDHYAVVLLLPVAWLLERRQWWAVAIPLATSWPLIGIVPAAIYPAVFAAGLVGPLVVAAVTRDRDATGIPAIGGQPA
jgi:alpha-1,2-mannosyltransferase